MRHSTASAFTLFFCLLSQPSVVASAETTGVCPDGIATSKGDLPSLTQKTKSKWTLHICGGHENKFGKDVYSEFEIYEAKDKKFNKLNFQASAVDDYSVKKNKNGLTLNELALIDNEWLPIFKRDVRCTTKGCSVSRKKCANVKLKHKPKSAHELLEYYRKDAKRNASTGQATDESEIAIVLAAALGGEKESIEAFQKNPGFRLDGASAEEFEYAKRTLKQLKAMKCKL